MLAHQHKLYVPPNGAKSSQKYVLPPSLAGWLMPWLATSGTAILLPHLRPSVEMGSTLTNTGIVEETFPDFLLHSTFAFSVLARAPVQSLGDKARACPS